jgi:glycosyltransferase involved in cell wall biosynthesis
MMRIVHRVVDKPLPSLFRPEGPYPLPARSLRIMIVSQYFPPEVGATQTRVQAFAEFLAARGHEVTVIAEFPNHPRGVIPSDYQGRILEDDRSNPYRVLRVWVKTNPQKTRSTRMAFYLSYMTLAAAVAPLTGGVDVVLATSPPLFAAAAGLVIARVKRAPFVLDIRDLWPAAAVSLDELSPGILLTAAESLERLLYREAAAVIGVTRPFCDHVDRMRGSGPRTILIPNGTLDLFFSNGDPGARKRLGIPDDRFLVTFAGTHGIAQGLPAILGAAERANGDVHFAFIGEGPMKASLVTAAEARGVRNVTFHDQLALEEVPAILASSNALLVPLSAKETFAGFVPSKLFDFMAAGRPVILAARGEPARILDEAGGGIAIDPEEPDALVAAVRWLVDHPTETQEMGNRGRAFARKWLRINQVERLEQVLLDTVRVR